VPGRGSFWPLFDLVVHTPRIELRLPSDDDFAPLIEVIDRGVGYAENGESRARRRNEAGRTVLFVGPRPSG
jgi:hypothetical protein